jgi:hypothetical protein
MAFLDAEPDINQPPDYRQPSASSQDCHFRSDSDRESSFKPTEIMDPR